MDRNKILKKHLSLSFLYKGLGMVLLYITVPVLLDFLGVTYYGIWVTIFSIINWFYYFDVGIGNGLKNKLTETYAEGNITKAREYISTAFFSTVFLAVAFFVICTIGIYSFDLQSLLNVDVDESYLKQLFLVVLSMLMVSFVLNMHKQLFYSKQEASKVQLSIFIFQLLIFVQVVASHYFLERSLLLVAIIFGWTNILVGIIFNSYFFRKNKNLMLGLKFFKVARIKEIMGIGLEFFVIQLCVIFILTSDNLIITNLIGPEEVTVYDTVFKIFQVFLVVSTLILTPFWAMYTDAYFKKDFGWIKKTLKKMNILFLFLILTLLPIIYWFDQIIHFWIRKELQYSSMLILLMAGFVLVRVYGDIYIYFLNGAGKIKLQKILFIVGAIINIPLSILFVKYYDLGSEGVILATIISMFSFVIVMPIQVYSIIKKESLNAKE